MKRFLLLEHFFNSALLFISRTWASLCKKITLFDSKGEAIAYIDTSDELTIYLWDGDPVAYLYDYDHIYGFNGKHLGWFIDGIVWDNKGNVVGFIECKQLVSNLEL